MGDNVDLMVNARIQGTEHSNCSIHWTQQYAVLNKVNEPNLDKTRTEVTYRGPVDWSSSSQANTKPTQAEMGSVTEQNHLQIPPKIPSLQRCSYPSHSSSLLRWNESKIKDCKCNVNNLITDNVLLASIDNMEYIMFAQRPYVKMDDKKPNTKKFKKRQTKRLAQVWKIVWFAVFFLGLSTSCSNFLKKLLKSCSKTLISCSKVASKSKSCSKLAFSFLV